MLQHENEHTQDVCGACCHGWSESFTIFHSRIFFTEDKFWEMENCMACSTEKNWFFLTVSIKKKSKFECKLGTHFLCHADFTIH